MTSRGTAACQNRFACCSLEVQHLPDCANHAEAVIEIKPSGSSHPRLVPPWQTLRLLDGAGSAPDTWKRVRRLASAKHSRRATLIMLVVSVPVLSEQITVVHPSVSTLGRVRTIAFCFAIFLHACVRQ